MTAAVACADNVSGKPSLYDRIGVPRIINASGATTAVGGTLMVPEAMAAMAEASQSFVVIKDLNAKVGKAIAAATGAEAGYVTSGSAARDVTRRRGLHDGDGSRAGRASTRFDRHAQ